MFKAASWRRKRPGGSGDGGILANDPFRDISDNDDEDGSVGLEEEDVWRTGEEEEEEEDGGGAAATGGRGGHATRRNHVYESENAAQRRDGRGREKKRAKTAGGSSSTPASSCPRTGKGPGAKNQGDNVGRGNADGAPSSAADFVPGHLVAKKAKPRSMDREEALRIKKSLDSGDGVVALLKSLLGRSDDVAVSHIIECGLGASVKALRGKGGEVAILARDLTSMWKSKVACAMQDASTTNDDNANTTTTGGKSSMGKASAAVGRPGGSISAPKQMSDGVDEESERSRRDKAVGALDKVLGGARGKAKELEEALWKRYRSEGDDGFQYSLSIKSFVSNLPRNKTLREDIRSGQLTGEKAAKLTPKEMAHDGKKQQREATLTAAAFDDSMFITAKSQGAQTDKFTCPKCKKKDCSFYHEHLLPDNFWAYTNDSQQVMITCRLCGHEWRE